MSREVEIQATYVGNQPLLSILEANLDLEQVSVRRTELAVKAVFPLEILILATSVYVFEKLVLDPLINPIADKFNWVEATKKFLRPHQPFNITVRLSDNNFIEASLELDHDLVAKVWQIISDTVGLLRETGMLEETSLIRITSDSPGNPLVISYRGSRPSMQILVSEGRIREIPDRRE